MTQMPRLVSQVRVDRMRTRSRPESSIFCASSSVISVLAWTMISLDSGSDVLGGDASENTIAQRLDDIAAFDQRRGVDVLHGAAVVFADDDVLGDVDQPPRQVT